MQVDDPKNAGKLRISELDPGDVFRDVDGTVCIMTDNTNEEGFEDFLDPATGQLWHHDDDPLVTLLVARLVVLGDDE